MPDTDNRSAATLAAERIARARAGRSSVDADGRPTSPPNEFHYDPAGRLVTVTEPEQPPTD